MATVNLSRTGPEFFVDSALGSDTPGNGLTSGAGAYATIPYAINDINTTHGEDNQWAITLNCSGSFTVSNIILPAGWTSTGLVNRFILTGTEGSFTIDVNNSYLWDDALQLNSHSLEINNCRIFNWDVADACLKGNGFLLHNCEIDGSGDRVYFCQMDGSGVEVWDCHFHSFGTFETASNFSSYSGKCLFTHSSNTNSELLLYNNRFEWDDGFAIIVADGSYDCHNNTFIANGADASAIFLSENWSDAGRVHGNTFVNKHVSPNYPAILVTTATTSADTNKFTHNYFEGWAKVIQLSDDISSENSCTDFRANRWFNCGAGGGILDFGELFAMSVANSDNLELVSSGLTDVAGGDYSPNSTLTSSLSTSSKCGAEWPTLGGGGGGSRRKQRHKHRNLGVN